MSQRSERLREALPDDRDGALDLLEEFYHVPVLAVLLAFMLWVRTRGWENFVTESQVFFSGNDAWYHLRQVQYTVRNWPFTMPFDPWTGFPTGTWVGQFGTLYDQLVATAALLVGLGSPSQRTVALTLLFAPAVIGTLTAVPVYAMGRRLGGRPGGLVAVLVLALTPGSFLRRSVVGFSDHHIAESFFLAVALALAMVAISVVEVEKPIWELVEAREWDALRRSAVWSALAGVGVTLYIWVWPPGVMLVGILGLFFVLKLSADYLRGESPDHGAFAAVVSMVVVALLTLLTIDGFDVSTTKLSLLQPLFALGVAAGAAFMAWLARAWDDRGLNVWLYPAAIAAIGLAALAVLAVAVPDLFDYLVGQVLRVVGYNATAESRTVGEAQPIPLDQASQYFTQAYGLAFYLAAGGLLYGIWALVTRGPRGELLLAIVAAAFMTAATLTQQRFDYYLAVVVAVLVGYATGRVLALVDLDAARSVRDVESYQVMVILAVLLLVTGPFVAFPSAAQPNSGPLAGTTLTSIQTTEGSAPGEVQQWDSTLRWMQRNTPQEGQYARPNSSTMEYYGRYPRVDDYSYQEGAYGVMSWWDYGHYITVLGERIPYSNPFQQHAEESAVYLLEPYERNANQMLVSDTGEETRYVMLDWKLAYPLSGKFAAPTAFYDNSGYPTNASDVNFDNQLNNDLYRVVFDSQSGRLGYVMKKQRHYRNMRTRLYKFHGSAVPVQPVVADYELRQVEGRTYAVTPRNESAFKTFRTMRQARQYVQNDSSAQIGGIGRFPNERVPALEHYRLVKASQSSAYQSRQFQQLAIQEARGLGLCQGGNQCLQVFQQLGGTAPQWVKTFERVPGATVQGTGPANTTVTARVQMRMPATNSTFNYSQRTRTGPDGEFTMTLPYSTTDYAKWGTEEGYTNVNVRATGPYTFSTPLEVDDNLTATRWSATAHVPEGQVIGAADGPVQVELQQETLDRPEGAQNNTTAPVQNGSDTNTTDSDANTSDSNTNTSDSNTSDAGSGTNDSNDSTQASRARPAP